MSVSRKGVTGGEWRVVPLGDQCLIVEFESRVDAGINRRARSFAGLLLRDPPPGVVDVVPAFCTVAVYYRPHPGASNELPCFTAALERLGATVPLVSRFSGRSAVSRPRPS